MRQPYHIAERAEVQYEPRLFLLFFCQASDLHPYMLVLMYN